MVPRRETQLPGMFFRFCSAFPGKSIERGRAEPRGPRFFFSSIRIGRNLWGGRLIIEKFQKLINNCARIIVSTSLGSTHFSRLCDCARVEQRIESNRRDLSSISMTHRNPLSRHSSRRKFSAGFHRWLTLQIHPLDSDGSTNRFRSHGLPSKLSRNIVYWDIGKFSVNFLFFLLF